MDRSTSVDPEAFESALAALRSGGVIGFPTDTVYGLGASISSESGVRRIYELKRRPLSRPLIAHVSGAAMAKELVAYWSDRAEALAAKFWPGPLTLVLPKAPQVSDLVTGDGPTIGVRAPDHAATLRLIDALGEAIAGTSANRSGEPSLLTADEVRQEFASDLVHVFDAGRAHSGVESTVVLLGENPADDRLLRPGPIRLNDLI